MAGKKTWETALGVDKELGVHGPKDDKIFTVALVELPELLIMKFTFLLPELVIPVVGMALQIKLLPIIKQLPLVSEDPEIEIEIELGKL